MSMHLEGPWLSTTGKKKGKRKFRNADEARKARQLAESWQELIKKYEPSKPVKQTKSKNDTWVPQRSYHRETEKINSLPFTGGPCLKPEQKIYTGTKVKGIGTMHKSNAVPIFSDEEAVEISKMRR